MKKIFLKSVILTPALLLSAAILLVFTASYIGYINLIFRLFTQQIYN
ncbi:hypothetical protein [uncultured Lutibacter sp.]|nr:hypothetical protein [uncultured Lutibacter sp.]